MFANPFDLIAIATVLGFCLLGGTRGLVDQILRILPAWGTVVLMFFSQSFWAPIIAPWLPKNYQSITALIVAGVAAYPIMLLVVRFLLWRLAGTALGGLNRLGGAGIGACQGLLIVTVVFFGLWLSPVANEKAFQKSLVAKEIYPYVQKASQQYLWTALKAQPQSWVDTLNSYWKS